MSAPDAAPAGDTHAELAREAERIARRMAAYHPDHRVRETYRWIAERAAAEAAAPLPGENPEPAPNPAELGMPTPEEIDFTAEVLDGVPQTFRRQFLWRFELAEDRAAVALVGQILHEHLFETQQRGPVPHRDPMRQELEAASADLMDCANDLCSIAARPRGVLARWSEPEAHLARRAQGWASEAAVLAKRIWNALSAVDPPRPADPPR